MAKRTVTIGLMTYTSPDGYVGRFASHGETVDVHKDDLERFDRLNQPPAGDPEPAEVPAAEPVEPTDPATGQGGDPDDPDVPEVDLSRMKVADLVEYAAMEDIDLTGARTKAEIILMIDAAEAARAAANPPAGDPA